MIPLLHPSDYHNPTQFQNEQDQLFSSAWLFIGFARQLTNHNDWICEERAGKSVVVQNFEGSLKAFTNVCSHRFSRIRDKECGNGPLKCPYHGWMYNAEGLPYAVPKRPKFPDLDQEMMCSLALESWSVDVVGEFVFVCGDADGPSLKSFLGCSATALLESISTSMGDKIDTNTMSLGCNWKIAVENTLESYHVGFIHPQTFHKLGAHGEMFQFEGPHSRWDAELSEETIKRWVRVSKSFQSRIFTCPGYTHQFIFPNLTVATTFGNSFSIQLFHPKATEETSFVSHVFGAKLDALSTSETAIVAAMNQSIVDFNRKVFAEDKDVCELVQKGCREAKVRGLLSDEEARVGAFQNALSILVHSEA